MELHGGTIAATSEGLGKGTCFTIEVPLSSPPSDCDTLEPDVQSRESLPVGHRKSNKFMSLSWHLLSRVTPCVEPSHFPLNWRFAFGCNRVADTTKICELNRQSDPNSDLAQIFPTSFATSERRSDSTSHQKTGHVNDKKSSSENIDLTFTNSRKKSILIVDDVPMNRKMLKRLLINRFDECMEAENGQQAVDMVKEALELGIQYEVVAIDYQMPVMDGVTATTAMRKIGYTGRIIGITGNAMQEDLNSFMASGADIVLTKPLSVAKFDEYLTTLV